MNLIAKLNKEAKIFLTIILGSLIIFSWWKLGKFAGEMLDPVWLLIGIFTVVAIFNFSDPIEK